MTTGTPIVMPKLGLTMTEGMLAEWKVAPGDSVAAGDILFVVETDKIANEIEATEAGVIEVLATSEGESVPVGTVVAFMRGDGSGPVSVEPEGSDSPTPPEAAPLASPAFPTGDRRVATPLARRIARQKGIDLAMLSGSGPRGRIMADDVIAAEAGPAPLAAPTDEIVPLGRFQAVTARRLSASKRDIPHFYVFAEADVTFLLDLRVRLNAEPRADKITVSHFLIAAMARALAAMPEMNRVWAETGLRQLRRVDIGLAVESPRGLIAPLLADMGAKTLDEVVADAAALVARARTGRPGGSPLEGGATTISNVGMFGATALIPIINPGQSSILGVGRAMDQFRPDAQGRPILRQTLQLALSCDHRVIDGALAARFLQSVQMALEQPLPLLRPPVQGPHA